MGTPQPDSAEVTSDGSDLDPQRREVLRHCGVVRAVCDGLSEGAVRFIDRVVQSVADSTESTVLCGGNSGVTLAGDTADVAGCLDPDEPDEEVALNSWLFVVLWLAERASAGAVDTVTRGHRGRSAEALAAGAAQAVTAAEMLAAAEALSDLVGDPPERELATNHRDWTFAGVSQPDGWQVLQMSWPDGSVYVSYTSKSAAAACKTLAGDRSMVRQKLEGDPVTPTVDVLGVHQHKQDAVEQKLLTLQGIADAGRQHLLNRVWDFWLNRDEEGGKRCLLCQRFLPIGEFPMASKTPDGRRRNCGYCHRLEQRFVRTSTRATGDGRAGYQALRKALKVHPNLAREPMPVIAEQVAAAFPDYQPQR